MFFFCRRSNSTVTLSSLLIGTRWLFWCFAVFFWRNFDFITCVFDRLIFATRWRNCDSVFYFTLHEELSIWLTHLPLLTCCCTAANPRLLKILSQWWVCVHPPQLLDKHSHNSHHYSWPWLQFHPEFYRFVRECFEIFILICSDPSCGRCTFEKFFLMILHTLPKSIVEIATICPYWMLG